MSDAHGGGSSSYRDERGESSSQRDRHDSRKHARDDRDGHSYRKQPRHEDTHEARGESREVRSVRKKVETLNTETAKLDAEQQELEHRKRKAKQAAREATEELKTDFLRTAAVIQTKIDLDNEKEMELRAENDARQPELLEARAQLKDLDETHARRRAEMERQSKERLAAINAELLALREACR